MSDMKVTVEFCMGSSCFYRGNKKSLELVKNYVKEKGLEDKIDLRGQVCLGLCSKGPNVRIADTMYNQVAPNCVIDLIEHHLGQTSKKEG